VLIPAVAAAAAMGKTKLSSSTSDSSLEGAGWSLPASGFW